MRLVKGLALLALLPMLTAAREPLRLAPSSKWVVDYADNSCRLLRTFGSGADASTMVIERAAPNDSMSLLMVGEPFRASNFARDFVANFAPVAEVKATRGASAKTEAGSKPAILWSSFSFQKSIEPAGAASKARMTVRMIKRDEKPPQLSAQARALAEIDARTNASNVTSIEVTRPTFHTVILETGSMGTPNKMMDDCARNQLVHWGIDPAIDSKIVSRPWGDLLGILTYDDYPRESLWKSRESALVVRLLVDANGKVTNCTALTQVADQSFPDAVCAAFMTRAKLHPAELEDGTKVPSYYIQRVQFRAGS